MKRVDRASRTIAAPPARLYDALLDRDSLASWLPPEGATATIDLFEPHEGGAFHMTLRFDPEGHSAPGKTAEHEDVVTGRFVRLAPGREVVQAIEFQSDDPSFAGTMIMTWTFDPAPGGTLVTIACEDVPAGIGPEDHQAGLDSSLANLAAFAQ